MTDAQIRSMVIDILLDVMTAQKPDRSAMAKVAAGRAILECISHAPPMPVWPQLQAAPREPEPAPIDEGDSWIAEEPETNPH